MNWLRFDFTFSRIYLIGFRSAISGHKKVDATGFEPATSASRIEHCFLYAIYRDPESA